MSIIFIFLFICCILGVLYFPKTESYINGLKVVVMGTMAVLCYLVLMAWFYEKMHLRVGIVSSCISLFAADILLVSGILKKRKLQRVLCKREQIFGFVIALGVVIILFLHIFSKDLLLQYANIEAGKQFAESMNILRNGTVERGYFAAFLAGLFIEILQPFLNPEMYYQAFVIADIFMYVLEIGMFFVLVISLSNKKIVHYWASVFSVAYFFGYPAYNVLTGNMTSWSSSGMITIFLIYALLLIERNSGIRKYAYVLFALGVFSNFCGDNILGISNLLIVITMMIFFFLRLKAKGTCGKVRLAFAAGLFAFMILSFWVCFELLGGSIKAVQAELLTNGEIYRSLYAELIYFIPSFVIVCYFTFINHEYTRTVVMASLCTILNAIIMHILWQSSYISTFNYYKVYYVLWIMGWLLCVMALDIMKEKRMLPEFFSFLAMILVLGWIVFSNYDYKMWFHNPNYNGSYATRNFFSLYRYNLDACMEDYEKYKISQGTLNIIGNSIEENQRENVPFIWKDEKYCVWYDALSDNYSLDYNMSENEFPDLIMSLEKNKVKKIIIEKTKEYEIYQDYFEKCGLIAENEEIAFYSYAGSGWTDVMAIDSKYSKDKEELFLYAEKYADIVPLMADQSSYLDFIMYEKLTGTNSKEFYTWKFNPKENLENLNACGIQYIIVLKDDSYYMTTKEYFDTQETIYENDTGKIIKCDGDNWSTIYE